jgi:Ca2+-binding RTX toxin-like protein
MARLIVVALTIALLAIPPVASSVSAAKPTCNGLVATHVGNARGNVIRGTAGRDVIVARGGPDKIFGRGGNDVICAGKGADIVSAGAGRDKVFGQSGKDVLKGGAGFDLLDGGLAKDKCYAGAGGAKLSRCEEADFFVSMQSPSHADEDQSFSFLIRVKNIGAKSGWFDLEVSETLTGVVCGFSADETRLDQSLAPGGWLDYSYHYTSGCSAGGGGSHTLSLTASITPHGLDDDPGNDSATSTTQIDPA